MSLSFILLDPFPLDDKISLKYWLTVCIVSGFSTKLFVSFHPLNVRASYITHLGPSDQSLERLFQLEKIQQVEFRLRQALTSNGR